MSTRMNNVSQSKFCKVCRDAGKVMFTNHNVKEKNKITGEIVVVCPTLLNTYCRWCDEKGHIAKYCPVLSENNKIVQQQMQIEQKKQIAAVPQKKVVVAQKMTIQSRFSLLDDNISSDDEKTQTNKRNIETDINSSKKQKKSNNAAAAAFVQQATTTKVLKTYDSEFPEMIATTTMTFKDVIVKSEDKKPTIAEMVAKTVPKMKEETRITPASVTGNWTVFQEVPIPKIKKKFQILGRRH